MAALRASFLSCLVTVHAVNEKISKAYSKSRLRLAPSLRHVGSKRCQMSLWIGLKTAKKIPRETHVLLFWRKKQFNVAWRTPCDNGRHVTSASSFLIGRRSPIVAPLSGDLFIGLSRRPPKSIPRFRHFHALTSKRLEMREWFYRHRFFQTLF